MKPVNKHIMAMITFIILLPLVYFIPPFVSYNLTSEHLHVTVISVSIIVPLLSYILIPLVIKIINLISNVKL